MVNGALNVLLTLVIVVVGFTSWMLGVEAAEEEEEEEGEEEEERVDETANSAEPKRKKQKIILNRRVTSQKRDFQQDWKKGREWLQYSEHQGMWCSICYPFRQHPGVIGCKSKQNALAVPTKQFRYRNVSKHPDTNYHLVALGLSKKLQDPLANMHIRLPVEKVPQAKALFNSVLFMPRRGIAHYQMRALMDLQKGNGLKYDMKYQSSYTPVIMHYLALAARDYFRKQWNGATSKALMTDEVKIGDAQWLTTSARLYVSGKFVDLPVSPARFLVVERDAAAIAQTLEASFSLHGIPHVARRLIVCLHNPHMVFAA